MKRPTLNQIPLASVSLQAPGQPMMTVSVGQWTGWHDAAYSEGFLILELDRSERLVAAYQKTEASHAA